MKVSEPRVYGAGTIAPDPRWHMDAHFHAFHEIIAVRQGRLELRTPLETIVAESGDILFYRAGLVHAETSDTRDPVCIDFLAFDTGDPLPWLPLRTLDVHGRVRHLVRWLVDDVRGRRGAELRRSFFDVLLGELRLLRAVPPDPWLEAMLGTMRREMARPLALDDLARRGGLSKFAFVRKFHRLRGRPPMEELRLMRLEQARTLLLTTNLPVKAIAPAVGIGDEFQLSKLFRRHFKLAPSQLRRRGTAALNT
ncbi:MAG TPA: helix-turn-helix domain-containing protein [Candidatus Methylacidiphilales bacterium]|nr:helix-turn-helix domain-containing protein [Candidatus Methylacidiphilales bacterium]